jgi:streptomycin 6-kinase
VAVAIPSELAGFASRGEDWQVWLAELPGLVNQTVAAWELTPAGDALSGHASMVVPVTTAAGEAAVVKFGWPHPEAEHEHLALREWNGRGAVRLLRADPRKHILLLERAEPVDLTSIPVLEACEVVAGLYGRLHLPGLPQLVRLSDLAADWSRRLTSLPAGAPIPRRYVEQAAALARDFATDAGTDGRMVHTDLHYFNVLASARDAGETWLAIDPKPVSGDPCFEVAPLLWNRWDEAVATGDVRSAVRARFHTVVDVAELDEQRVRDWVVVYELVNAMWTIEDHQRLGRSLARLSAEDSDWITRCVAITKAVQD